MIFALLTLLTALAISAVAAYFSIVGLVAIFSSAPIAIAIMGSVLEAAKLVTASWLYRFWEVAPRTIKYYFTVAVVILSLITSMGIFGYLSKAHIEQTTAAGTTNVELKILEQRELILKQKIDFLLKQDDKTTTVNNRIGREITQAQNELKEVLQQKAPILQSKNKLDAEVGPLKYITEFIYGESDDALMNKAVRWVIITLIFVFDPLAILLLIAANISFNNFRNVKPPTQKVTIKTESGEEYVVDSGEDVVIDMTQEDGVRMRTEEPAPPPKDKESWSKELYRRMTKNNNVNIERSRIHSIPKEILDKVFRK